MPRVCLHLRASYSLPERRGFTLVHPFCPSTRTSHVTCPVQLMPEVISTSPVLSQSLNLLELVAFHTIGLFVSISSGKWRPCLLVSAVLIGGQDSAFNCDIQTSLIATHDENYSLHHDLLHILRTHTHTHTKKVSWNQIYDDRMPCTLRFSIPF